MRLAINIGEKIGTSITREHRISPASQQQQQECVGWTSASQPPDRNAQAATLQPGGNTRARKFCPYDDDDGDRVSYR